MKIPVSAPLALVAELTHRCPLHCVYCSNPIELTRREWELSTAAWTHVLRQAGELGVLQVDFTGGEPLARPDLAELIRAARSAGLYASLITSGLPIDQDAHEESANEFAGAPAHAQKLRVAEWVKRHRIALTLNFVIHRRNLDQLEEMLALTREIAPSRVEFAHVQYYGWAFANRGRLLPTRQQLDRSLEILKRAEEQLRGRIRVEYVVPDYYAKYPKACMGGWGRKVLLITPTGEVLPCHAAKILPGMKFENVEAQPLRQIWEESDAFQKFRGEDWMPEPCRSCDRHGQDFGGCRCQAFLLAGDATATDPVCSLAPRRNVVDAILNQVNTPPSVSTSTKPEWLYRINS
jgi:PqqA peptide cyclase